VGEVGGLGMSEGVEGCGRVGLLGEGVGEE